MTHDEALDLAAGYVLGALEPAEEAAVRAHLASSCPESHAAFEELGGVVASLLEDVELVEPPAALGDRIMAAAAADLAERMRGGASGTPAAPAAGESPVEPIAFPSSEGRTARAERTRAERTRAGASTGEWLLRIAAAVAIVVLGGWNLLLQGQLDGAREYDRAVAAVIDAASHPNAQTVVLTPEGGTGPSGLAAVAADGTVVLAMRNLAATSGSQVYETWVITGETPIALGSFTVGADGTAAFTTRPAETPAGAIIALTLEPNAGNNAPQGSVVAKGVAPAPVG